MLSWVHSIVLCAIRISILILTTDFLNLLLNLEPIRRSTAFSGILKLWVGTVGCEPGNCQVLNTLALDL